MKNQQLFYLIILAFFGVVISFFFAKNLYTIETSRILSDFRNDVNSKSMSLEREFSLSFESLQSLKVLFDYSEHVDETMFHDAANAIYVRHENIQALEWIPKVTNERRNDYINKRRESHPEFAITERGETGIKERKSYHNVYFPVYYVEPMAGNEAAFGYDLASSAERLKAIEKSRDTGKLVLTESIDLVQEKENQKGLLSFLPVYINASTTLEQRKKNLLGFVLGVFRVGDIFNSALSHSATDNIEITLIDKSDGMDDVLHKNLAVDENATLLKQLRYEKRVNNMHGRQWYLSAIPTDNYIKQARGLLPHFVFISGAFFSIFGAFLFYIITYRSVMIAREKHKIYQATVSASQHVLNNFLHQMQLFRIEAERVKGFNPRILKLYSSIIDEATTQVNELSNVKQLDDESIKASVYPKGNE